MQYVFIFGEEVNSLKKEPLNCFKHWKLAWLACKYADLTSATVYVDHVCVPLVNQIFHTISSIRGIKINTFMYDI